MNNSKVIKLFEFCCVKNFRHVLSDQICQTTRFLVLNTVNSGMFYFENTLSSCKPGYQNKYNYIIYSYKTIHTTLKQSAQSVNTSVHAMETSSYLTSYWNYSNGSDSPKYSYSLLLKLNNQTALKDLPVILFLVILMIVGIVGNITVSIIYSKTKKK